MSAHTTPRPPWLGRLLARAIAGPDADTLRGDIEESWRHRAQREGNTLRVRASFVLDVLRSLAHWWLPRRPRHPAPGSGQKRMMTGLTWAELRHVARGVARRPGYTATVVLTLGIGIGATTTLYSVVDAMLVRALPYPHADRLIVVGNTLPDNGATGARGGLLQLQNMSLPNMRDIQAKVPDLASVALLERRVWLPNESQGPALIQVANVTPEFFEILGVKPRLGRLLRAGDDLDRAHIERGFAVVISYDGWQRRFGGDPGVIGRTVPGGSAFAGSTIVGVLPRGFRQPQAIVHGDVEFFLYLDPGSTRYSDRQRRGLRVLASLRPGANMTRVRAEITAAQAQLVRDVPAANTLRDGTPVGAGFNTLRDETIGSAARPTLVLLGASLLLLLLAGVNASNLLLVRGLERSGNVAIRRALGAGRTRIMVSQVLESVALALLGGLLGLLFARLGVLAFRRWGPQDLPRIHEVAVNLRIALAGGLLSIAVGGGIGLVPALRSGRTSGLAGMRVHAGVQTREGARLRTVLAATQLALALVLGVGASLLFRSFAELRAQPLGFQPRRLQTFVVPYKSEQMWLGWDQILGVVRSTPGVGSAAITSNLPLQPASWQPHVERPDQPGSAEGVGTQGIVITPGYLALAGIPLLRGRDFNGGDRPGTRPVCIISQSLARARFGDSDPIGQLLHVAGEFGPALECRSRGPERRCRAGKGRGRPAARHLPALHPGHAVRTERTVIEHA